MQIDDKLLDAILPGVQKPARYTGGEYNSVVKDWESVEVRVALAFPDVYELGMSNLGLAILYDVINALPFALAERVYLPWTDMEEQMRMAGIPLYSLETRRPLAEFDVIGVTLPYEQLFSNTLQLLHLAGLPVMGRERDGRHPLVVAGGGAAFNPEPMADFIDAFAVGEGEELIVDVLEVCRDTRGRDREAQLRALARVPGIYVPRFYEVGYNEDGTTAGVRPIVEGVPEVVTKRVVAQLPPPPTRLVVPYVDTTHNRAPLEIQRGCTRGCRFCHAGMTTRPVRERPLSQLLEAVEEIMAKTGYEEIGLLSLSSSDYSRVEELVRALTQKYDERKLSVSLPSLRIDSFSVGLAEMLQTGRRSGFTFAPEAGTERMRDVINKPITTDGLLEVVEEVYRRNWLTVKLYFMIGQPTETGEDVYAIAGMVRQVHEIGRRIHGKKAQVRVTISTFVPKPHTPFQWAPLAERETLLERQRILRESVPRRGVDLSWNDPDESLFEAALGMGDRRVGGVIHAAWRSGARFDAWREHFRPTVWWEAFAEAGLDPEWYARRGRGRDEVLPWEHVSTGVSKKWLWADYRAALKGMVKTDCRRHCYNCGILDAFAPLKDTSWGCP